MTEKDYSQWHQIKTSINNAENHIFFHEREVWWCSVGVNIGHEQDGVGAKFLRPVLVFKKFNNSIFWAIPITAKVKIGKFYKSILLHDGMPRIAIISQLKLIDSKRLVGKIGRIGSENYKEIQKAIMELCAS